jgi:hypothetical protein
MEIENLLNLKVLSVDVSALFCVGRNLVGFKGTYWRAGAPAWD